MMPFFNLYKQCLKTKSYKMAKNNNILYDSKCFDFDPEQRF